jgi:CheY-like chemotaxis protein
MSTIEEYVRLVEHRLPRWLEWRLGMVSDLRSHLAERVAAGEAEAAVVASMEPPEEYAAACIRPRGAHGGGAPPGRLLTPLRGGSFRRMAQAEDPGRLASRPESGYPEILFQPDDQETTMAPVSEGPSGVGAHRILVVEDDDALRRLFSQALRSQGYEVEEASTGFEAVEAFYRQCPDVLLSDLVLPGPNGQELARRCRARCPDAILIFMSGYAGEELHELDITQVVFLSKPVSPAEMVRTVERLLARREDED